MVRTDLKADMAKYFVRDDFEKRSPTDTSEDYDKHLSTVERRHVKAAERSIGRDEDLLTPPASLAEMMRTLKTLFRVKYLVAKLHLVLHFLQQLRSTIDRYSRSRGDGLSSFCGTIAWRCGRCRWKIDFDANCHLRPHIQFEVGNDECPGRVPHWSSRHPLISYSTLAASRMNMKLLLRGRADRTRCR